MSSPVKTLHKRHGISFAVLFGLTITGPAVAQETAKWPTDGWSSSTPEAEGLDGSPFVTLDETIRDGVYGNVDRLVVVRNGRLVVSERYDNDYESISKGSIGPLGCGADSCADEAAASDPYNYLHPTKHPFYKGRDVHSLQSVTKSVAATAIGIALHRGEIATLDELFLSFFEAYAISEVDPRLRTATLADLLTMRSGLEWPELGHPLDETNIVLKLERSEDWIQFTLDQPSDAPPGEKWAYNSGGSHLLSGVIKNATGSYVDEYTDVHLFKPLGIDSYHWKKTPRGYPDTEGGLYLEAEQLAKIGYLYLQGGVWDGQVVLDADFVAAATALQVDSVNGRGWGYGYQWWRLDTRDTEVWAGLGFGDQYLLILPEYDLIGVVNSWNVFGGRRRSILRGLLNALLESVMHSDSRNPNP